MGFTEFHCDAATGVNTAAGDNKTLVTSTNGDWGNAAANRFTAASGTPFSGVVAGDFAAIYLDGASVAAYVARVTAVNGGGASLDLSATAKAGTPPANGASGRTCTVGGKWKGPNAAVGFPFDFVENTLTNAAGDFPRVNFKSGTTYAITAAITHSKVGPIRWEGYTTTPGDGGRFIVDGGTSGASYILLSVTGANNELISSTFQNNGATGSAAGLSLTGSRSFCRGLVVNSVRGAGVSMNSAGGALYEWETYGCNQSNTALTAGVIGANNFSLRRGFSHDNAGSNSSGIYVNTTGVMVLEDIVVDTNGAHGLLLSTVSLNLFVRGIDAYNNGGDGISLTNTGTATVHIENSNFVKNGGWGINGSGAGARNGSVFNCGFGSGTQANTSGTTTGLKSMVESGSVTYAANATPWVDPANGDFRVSLSAAKGTGRGTFTQTAASYAGTVSQPDIGAAHIDGAPRFGLAGSGPAFRGAV